MSVRKETLTPIAAEHEGVEGLEILTGDFSVDDVVEAETYKSLMERSGDMMEVVLWLGEKTSSLHVTVTDYKNLGEGEAPVERRLDVPTGHNPLDRNNGLFYHPMSYLDV